MVDISDAISNDFVTVDLIKTSKIKTIIPVAEGNYEMVEYNQEKKRKLRIPVQHSGINKTWQPNTDSLRNIGNAYGYDTKKWIGRKIMLNISIMRGREILIASPMYDNVSSKDLEPGQDW